MSTQNPRDLISKASWTLMEGIKDAVATNVASVAKSAQIALKGPDMEKLLMIVAASVEEGYHRGSRVFSRAVDNALAIQLTDPIGAPGEKSKKSTKK
jgi:hypothetical protein